MERRPARLPFVDLGVNRWYVAMMPKSPNRLATLLTDLSRQARAAGLTDTEWAARAGVRKETLSRLRGRQTCDLATVAALADALDLRLGMLTARTSTADGHFPASMSRDYEQRLVELCLSNRLEANSWAALGPRFFMAGLAVMLASLRGFDRQGLLALAEQLHPGASEPPVFGQWLKRSPLRPSRFVPLLRGSTDRAA